MKIVGDLTFETEGLITTINEQINNRINDVEQSIQYMEMGIKIYVRQVDKSIEDLESEVNALEFEIANLNNKARRYEKTLNFLIAATSVLFLLTIGMLIAKF